MSLPPSQQRRPGQPGYPLAPQPQQARTDPLSTPSPPRFIPASRTNLTPQYGAPYGGPQTAQNSSASLISRPGSRTSNATVGSSGSEDTRGPPGSFQPSRTNSIASKFSLTPDPGQWGALPIDVPEADDILHNPDPKRDRRNDGGGTMFTWRGLENLGCIFIMASGLLMLFLGYPLVYHFMTLPPPTNGAFNLGGINASGQVPQLIGNFGLIDVETPSSALTHTGLADGSTYNLIFSDEFNTDGRTFYPGDDPYWEAVDLHYWETGNLEWYDPSAVVTEGGQLKIWLNNTPNHGLNYMGGMVSSWNKFCFTGGYIEVSVSLPGTSNVYGLWPAVWTMGNLGRAGYGGSLDGMWPYSYDTCDVGTLQNQTLNDQPTAALTTGDPDWGGTLSFLPGQRLSACTCPGEDHPGPKNSDGTFVGRSAPEIDILEAQVDDGTLIGYVSQSGQWAPFDAYWMFQNTSDADYKIYNTALTTINSYHGGVYQEASSALTQTDQQCYTADQGCFQTYGYEYEPGNDGYITWVSSGLPAWTVYAQAMGPNQATQIGQRPVPQEPMYILMNLGISPNFGPIDFTGIEFPVYMLIDYVRVYQKPSETNWGCDPPDFPTEAYINEHANVYSDWNLTTWAQAGGTNPKNRLIDQC